MLLIHNAYGTIDDDQLVDSLGAQVPAPIRDRIEAWHDAYMAQENGAIEDAKERGWKEAEEAAQPYVDAWDTLYTLWEDNLANGHWPNAHAGDGTLLVAMAADIERAGKLSALIGEALSGDVPPGEALARLRKALAAE